jgi:DNA mismatch endonuclease (patch repair protein)
MAMHPRRDTRPEMAIRRLLHAQGLRYRVCIKVPGAPRRTIDIAFTRAKIAVFVDGCFWHGCPDHGLVPASNRQWWVDKILRNRDRDAETSDLLVAAGWCVVRAWEHEPAADVVDRVSGLVRAAADGQRARTRERGEHDPDGSGTTDTDDTRLALGGTAPPDDVSRESHAATSSQSRARRSSRS